MRPAATIRPGRERGRIGILGGSFNPAHDGHRHISLMAMRRLRLDAVWWLVSPQNPLKPVAGMAPFAERLAGAARMARHPRIEAVDIEARLGTRYTVDTMAALARRFPAARFVWLMGADNLIQLPRWRRWPEIMRRVPVAVLARPSYSLRAAAAKPAQRYAHARLPARAAARLAAQRPPTWVLLPIRLHPASGTAIRAGRAGGR